MRDFEIHPSTRLIKPYYVVSLLLGAGILIYGRVSAQPIEILVVLPALLLLWTALRHLHTRFTVLRLESGKLRYQTGVLSRSTRTLEISKVQDVRVDQSLVQRVLGIGSLTLETAGETSRLTMANVDRPQEVADRILEAARPEPPSKEKHQGL